MRQSYFQKITAIYGIDKLFWGNISSFISSEYKIINTQRITWIRMIFYPLDGLFNIDYGMNNEVCFKGSFHIQVLIWVDVSTYSSVGL